ncbi:hypothetical protein AGMMS49982_03890 [Bacteroidia bacterium]|nr:hypothetical protein AGMMS49982_03890 [Bacteroidia bacterium]
MKYKRRKRKKKRDLNRWNGHFKNAIKTITDMSFFDSKYQYISSKRKFGLCDDEPPPHKPAYLDEKNGKNWIAIVKNDRQIKVRFVALDHSIILRKPDGTQDRCSDGLLTYSSTIIFVELTTGTNKNWKNDKDEQLRITIKHFEDTKESDLYDTKQAYIANNNSRVFRPSYQIRMDKFLFETGYDLRIENRIEV